MPANSAARALCLAAPVSVGGAIYLTADATSAFHTPVAAVSRT